MAHTPTQNDQGTDFFYNMKEKGVQCAQVFERIFSRISNVKRRHLVTNDRKLRLRYYIPFVIVSSFAAYSAISQFTLLSNAQASIPHIKNIQIAESPVPVKTQQIAYVQKLPEVPKSSQQSGSENTNNSGLLLDMLEDPVTDAVANVQEPQRNETEKVTLASFYKTAKPDQDSPRKIKIEEGQTVTGQLQEIGISTSEAFSVVEALGEHFDPRRVRPGQSFDVEYTERYNNDGILIKNVSKMTMPISPAKQIVVYRDDDSFRAKEIEKKIITTVDAGRASVKYSLYGSAAKADIPDEIIANMIKIFSWTVDFQRDIRSGDEIEILYEIQHTEDGTPIGYGDILYARLVTGGKDLSLYRHKMKNGHVDYFDPKGQSIKRTLMKTPVDGARMSSGYGMRRHPVLGYNKMHKGVDFAAPRGTPIYAAGDGVIEQAGRKGSYGNYIRIRHNSKLKTAYAHLHRIKSGIRAGTRVKQGQVIGTVGSTGRSTGPHLHYEVLINGKQVNPRGVNVPTGEVLKGAELKRFQANKNKFDQKFARISNGEEYAAVSESLLNN